MKGDLYRGLFSGCKIEEIPRSAFPPQTSPMKPKLLSSTFNKVEFTCHYIPFLEQILPRGYYLNNSTCILCLTSRTTVTSACIPVEDARHRARNLCVFSRIQKGTPGLSHKGCVSQRVFSVYSCILDCNVLLINYMITAQNGNLL